MNLNTKEHVFIESENLWSSEENSYVNKIYVSTVNALIDYNGILT